MKDNLLDQLSKEKQELKDKVKNFEAEKEWAHLKDKSLLIIDDDPDFIELITTLLKKIGMNEVHCVSSEIEAISYLTNNSPDLILLDVMLPKINGFSMGKIIREMSHSNIPILYITANKNFRQDFNLVEDKLSDHLYKPIDRNLLAKKINELIFSR